MPANDWKNATADPTAIAALATAGLEYRVIDTTATAVFDPYLQAVSRGFLSSEQSDEQIAASREGISFRRFVGVYDPASLDASQPVGTVNSWVTQLTLPGGSLPMWAISGVTVAPTHRRRGVARAMLEGELGTAAGHGLAIAGLTVSEATIYGRFGFSPATFAADWSIETKRAQWVGPRPDGRLDFLGREQAGDLLAELHGRVRSARPGEIDAWPGLWRRLTGQKPVQDVARKLRAVRYADAAGTTRGVVVFSLSDEGPDFTKHELQVQYLLSETDDAYAALWRFVLEYDLVSVVKAPLLSVDEPVRWMIADQRGATVTVGEHGWLRILDVPEVLTVRTYAVPGSLTLRVTDPLGFADGTWTLTVEGDGSAIVSPADGPVDVTLSVNALSSIVLGGVRATTLRTAGVVMADVGAADALDATFASGAGPYLSLWY